MEIIVNLNLNKIMTKDTLKKEENAIAFSDFSKHLFAVVVPEIVVDEALRQGEITQEQYNKRHTHCLLTKVGWMAMSRKLEAVSNINYDK